MPAQIPNNGVDQDESKNKGSPGLTSSFQSKIPILNQKSRSFFLFVSASSLAILIIVFFIIGIDQGRNILKREPVYLNEVEHDINKPENTIQRIRSLKQIPPEVKDVYKESFNKELNEAQNETEKFDAYYTIYSSLWARYNVTQDQEVFSEMRGLGTFIQKNWPDIYNNLKESGGFLE